ncbi:N-acetylmuramoyl-L-alanine amidase family protein [Plastoroseomonas arctica]|uniref:N-acetylmuramoyl-L-alanine amidase n=1 Tax=Plastoroseomonas arctica TaxID=1509237 RepID=A0AAF1JV82_9PROT|nr:N-acetylmuramoyl-L-alanine amidase [Plastoroseomonas arctica]MBR0654427.1 N-acetylmuramoyl-L-alanine amidase [Plastoroseomonas arctica]
MPADERPGLTRRHWLFAGLIVGLLPQATLAQALPLRISNGARRARLTLILGAGQRYAINAAAGPDRLIIQLPELAWPAAGLPARGGLIAELRFEPAASRLTVLLSEPARVRLRPGPAVPGELRLELTPVEEDAFARLVRAREPLLRGSLAATARARPLVVIDAGHGGRDPGTIGADGTLEKRITLATALELKRQLEAGGQVRVAMTRTRDIFVPLAARVDLARRQEAALFLSIHADSAPGARGASVYTLSDTATDPLSEALARRENNADAMGGLRLPSVTPEVASILLSLMRAETQAGSARIARLAVNELGEATALLPNTHRQAAFVVLKSPETPSALVELGFLSSSADEAALRRPTHRARLAQALARAVEGYVRA